MINSKIERLSALVNLVNSQRESTSRIDLHREGVIRRVRFSAIRGLDMQRRVYFGQRFVLIQANRAPPACTSRELFFPVVSFSDALFGYPFACLTTLPKWNRDIILTTVINGQRRTRGCFTRYLGGCRGISVD